ncbi:MAG: hypothetical protein WA885_20395 [Phormidesmis sp.]
MKFSALGDYCLRTEQVYLWLMLTLLNVPGDGSTDCPTMLDS